MIAPDERRRGLRRDSVSPLRRRGELQSSSQPGESMLDLGAQAVGRGLGVAQRDLEVFGDVLMVLGELDVSLVMVGKLIAEGLPVLRRSLLMTAAALKPGKLTEGPSPLPRTR